MDTLFPIAPSYPDGFAYYPEFITIQEEKDLYNQVRNVEMNTFMFQGYEAKRRVASFGYDYSFEKRSLSKGKEIPTAFDALLQKVAAHTGIAVATFAELLVTEYPVGSVINWHRDAPPFDSIAGISLCADCIFKLRPYEKAKQGKASVVSIPVKRRSLYIIQGAARTDWQHSISPVKQVRYSITLRTLK